ncbi:hypothetical protein IJJ08_01230 [bacterium]|nr:hypothetical protein [bacterium]
MKKTINTIIIIIIIALVGMGNQEAWAAKRAKKTPKATKKEQIVVINAQTDYSKILNSLESLPDGSLSGYLKLKVQIADGITLLAFKRGQTEGIRLETGDVVKKGTKVVINFNGRARPEVTTPATSPKATSATQQTEKNLLTASFQPEKVFGRGWRYVAEHQCWIGQVNKAYSFDNTQLTVIDRTTGQTLEAGTRLQKGREYKFFLKKKMAPVAPAPVFTSADRSVVLCNSQFMIQFERLADCRVKVVDSGWIKDELDLCLIGTEFIRNSISLIEFMTYNVERDFVVSGDMSVTVYDSKLRERLCRPGETVKKGSMAKIAFLADDFVITDFSNTHQGIYYAAAPTSTPTPAVAAIPEPVATPVPVTTKPTFVNSQYHLNNDLGKIVKQNEHCTVYAQLEQDMVVGKGITVKAKNKDGRWIALQQDAMGNTLVAAGTRNVYFFP